MKKVVIRGKCTVELVKVPDPSAIQDWALVKIHIAPMCTEYKKYQTGEMDEHLGHEAAGEVVEIDQPGDVRVGDRVVVMPQYPCGCCAFCLSGEYIHCVNNINFSAFTGSPEGCATYTQYLLKPSWLLPRIPDGMSYEHASMLCCGFGPTFGAMERMGVKAHDIILIVGMGPVGLGGVINGVQRGARVIAAAHHPFRANLARELGAEAVIDSNDPDALRQILDLTGGRGVEYAIDCAGNYVAQRMMIDATRRNGKVAFVGESGDLTLRVSDDLLRKGLTLYGIWHYNLNDVPKLFRIVQQCGGLVDKLITHSFSMDRVQDAWELQLTRQCGKVILYPWK